MPSASDRRVARLRARYQQRLAALADLGFILNGSLVQRFLPCGTPSCHCHADPPQLHGPYWQWSRRVQGKTVSRMLTAAQVARCEEWIENGKRLATIITELQDLATQATALLLDQERATHPRPRAPKHRRSTSAKH